MTNLQGIAIHHLAVHYNNPPPRKFRILLLMFKYTFEKKKPQYSTFRFVIPENLNTDLDIATLYWQVDWCVSESQGKICLCWLVRNGKGQMCCKPMQSCRSHGLNCLQCEVSFLLQNCNHIGMESVKYICKAWKKVLSFIRIMEFCSKRI